MRRDFTINALAINPDNSKIIDIVDDIKDLKYKVLHTIKDSQPSLLDGLFFKL
jgi:tRNA nucleotidyltransferase/poly(A) polymerase